MFAPMFALLLIAAAPATDMAAMRDLAALDLRVATVGDRLARGGLCRDRLSNPGIVVQDVSQYAAALRPAAVQALRLGQGPTIVAVVPGSHAATLGLAAGDEILTVDGIAPPVAGRRARSFDRVAATEALIEAGLARGGTRITLRRDGAAREVELPAVSGCRSRFQLQPGTRLNASADGIYVQVSGALVEFVASDDELAIVLAHELAHNILRHKANLDAAGVSRGLFKGFGRNGARIRAAEAEADRLALYLAARAGYDISVAPAFWERFGRKAEPILSDGTHAGWRDRVEAASREIARIRAQQAAGQPPTP
jgi:Zn-dependent protease with chaperone function